MMRANDRGPVIVACIVTTSWRDYFFTFFGSQIFFFFEVTKPHSLQRQSPGLAGRIGFPF